MLFAFFQTFTWYLSRFLGKVFLKMKVSGEGNISLLDKGGVLFISNHEGQLDPFLIGAAIPRDYYHKIKCFRYLTYYKYITRMLYGPFIWLCGAYPVNTKKDRGNYEKSLAKTLKYLNNNQSVLMFPTGKIDSDFDVCKSRPGVAYIAKNLNPLIMPVYITGTGKINIFNIFGFKNRVKIRFGKPFYCDNIEIKEDLAGAACEIMKKVEAIAVKKT